MRFHVAIFKRTRRSSTEFVCMLFCQICDISAKKFGQMLSLFECISQINSCNSNLFENSCKLTLDLRVMVWEVIYIMHIRKFLISL